jgi:hypothetical protein
MQAANVCQGSSESSHQDDSVFSNGVSADAMMRSKFSLANLSLIKNVKENLGKNFDSNSL